MASWYNEINPVSIGIVKLVSEGYSDREISDRLGFSRQTVYRYRHGLNIAPGRNNKVRKLKESTKKPKKLFNIFLITPK